MVHTARIALQTQGANDILDITPRVAAAIRESGLNAGTATVFVGGSTAGVTTIEHEPGLLADAKALFERLIPQQHPYQHNRGFEDNAHAHLRASLVGASLSIPFVESRLLLGTWQQVVLVDFDTRPRRREVVVQIMGE